MGGEDFGGAGAIFADQASAVAHALGRGQGDGGDGRVAYYSRASRRDENFGDLQARVFDTQEKEISRGYPLLASQGGDGAWSERFPI